MNKLTNLNFFLIWVFGFFVLLSFDLFVEGFVFEWLEWNGTNKNDWFFCSLVGFGCCLVFKWFNLFISKAKKIMDGLAVMGFVFGMVGVVALVRLEKLTKILKEKGILEENYEEE